MDRGDAVGQPGQRRVDHRLPDRGDGSAGRDSVESIIDCRIEGTGRLAESGGPTGRLPDALGDGSVYTLEAGGPGTFTGGVISLDGETVTHREAAVVPESRSSQCEAAYERQVRNFLERTPGGETNVSVSVDGRLVTSSYDIPLDRVGPGHSTPRLVENGVFVGTDC